LNGTSAIFSINVVTGSNTEFLFEEKEGFFEIGLNGNCFVGTEFRVRVFKYIVGVAG
jgi:hypothetical protein